jgi:hypothetical protein
MELEQQLRVLFLVVVTPGTTAVTECWDGTSWTEVSDLNTARIYIGGSGASNTSALAFGGQTTTPPATVANTESWNGSSWSEVNDLSSVRSQTTGTGTSTDSLIAGGWTGTAVTAATEEWTAPTVNSTLTAS